MSILGRPKGAEKCPGGERPNVSPRILESSFLKILLRNSKKTSIIGSLRRKMQHFGYTRIAVCVTISSLKVGSKLHRARAQYSFSTSEKKCREVKNE